MHRREFLANIASYGLLGGATCGASGCGTLLHRERCGQPHSRDLDWKVVALDGLGLLLFFVPGAIAFVVDFSTGAIYLPHDHHPSWPSYTPAPAHPQNVNPHLPLPPAEYYQTPATQSVQPLGLKRLPMDRHELNRQGIERVVSENVGHPVSLDESRARVSQLKRLDRFAVQRDQHRADAKFGHSVKAFFQKLLPANRFVS